MDNEQKTDSSKVSEYAKDRVANSPLRKLTEQAIDTSKTAAPLSISIGDALEMKGT